MVQVIYAVIVNQVLAGNIDSLETGMVYRYELDSVMVRMEDMQRQNTVLALLLLCLFVVSVAVVIFLVWRHRRNRERMESGNLANRLLKQQAAGNALLYRKGEQFERKRDKVVGKIV